MTIRYLSLIKNNNDFQQLESVWSKIFWSRQSKRSQLTYSVCGASRERQKSRGEFQEGKKRPERLHVVAVG
jgi:hypothetical protein